MAISGIIKKREIAESAVYKLIIVSSSDGSAEFLSLYFLVCGRNHQELFIFCMFHPRVLNNERFVLPVDGLYFFLLVNRHATIRSSFAFIILNGR